MKKAICLITVLLICISLAVPAFASESTFVPSITYKESPEIVEVTDEAGESAVGVIVDTEGNVTSYVRQDCLVITPVAEVTSETEGTESEEGTEATIPENVSEETKTLLTVYQGLEDGSMEIPYEELYEEIDTETAEEMVVLELVSVTWVCGHVNCEVDHAAIMEEEGTTFQITFDLGVAPDVEVYTMTYKNDQWNPILSTVNNGDGTVTCTFEHLCPVAFSVQVTPEVPEETAPEATEAPEVEQPTEAPVEEPSEGGSNLPWWIILLVAAVVALVAFISRKKKK